MYEIKGWTGNRQFERDLRTFCAKHRDVQVTHQGFLKIPDGPMVEGPFYDERDIFRYLKLPYIAPELRNA